MSLPSEIRDYIKTHFPSSHDDVQVFFANNTSRVVTRAAKDNDVMVNVLEDYITKKGWCSFVDYDDLFIDCINNKWEVTLDCILSKRNEKIRRVHYNGNYILTLVDADQHDTLRYCLQWLLKYCGTDTNFHNLVVHIVLKNNLEAFKIVEEEYQNRKKSNFISQYTDTIIRYFLKGISIVDYCKEKNPAAFEGKDYTFFTMYYDNHIMNKVDEILDTLNTAEMINHFISLSFERMNSDPTKYIISYCYDHGKPIEHVVNSLSFVGSLCRRRTLFFWMTRTPFGPDKKQFTIPIDCAREGISIAVNSGLFDIATILIKQLETSGNPYDLYVQDERLFGMGCKYNMDEFVQCIVGIAEERGRPFNYNKIYCNMRPLQHMLHNNNPLLMQWLIAREYENGQQIDIHYDNDALFANACSTDMWDFAQWLANFCAEHGEPIKMQHCYDYNVLICMARRNFEAFQNVIAAFVNHKVECDWQKDHAFLRLLYINNSDALLWLLDYTSNHDIKFDVHWNNDKLYRMICKKGNLTHFKELYTYSLRSGSPIHLDVKEGKILRFVCNNLASDFAEVVFGLKPENIQTYGHVIGFDALFRSFATVGNVHLMRKTQEAAALNNHVISMEFGYNMYNCPFGMCCSNGKLAGVDYLMDWAETNGTLNQNMLTDGFINACYNGHSEVVNHILAKNTNIIFGINDLTKFVQKIFRQSNPDVPRLILQLCTKHDIPFDLHASNEQAFYNAANNGFTETLRFLFQYCREHDTPINFNVNLRNVFASACKRDYIDTVILIYEEVTQVKFPLDMTRNNHNFFRSACENNCINVAQWFCTLDSQYEITLDEDGVNIIKYRIVNLKELAYKYVFEDYNKSLEILKIPSQKRTDEDCFEPECPICSRDDMINVLRLPCGHYFCLQCILEWISKCSKEGHNIQECCYCMQPYDISSCVNINIPVGSVLQE